MLSGGRSVLPPRQVLLVCISCDYPVGSKQAADPPRVKVFHFKQSEVFLMLLR